MTIALYILYLFVFLTILYGSLSYKFTNRFFKLLFFQATVYAILTVGVIIMEAYHTYRGLEYNNIAILNIHVGIEAILLFSAALVVLSDTLERRITVILFTIFLFAFTFQIFYFGPETKNGLADVVACLTLSVVYAMVLYKAIRLNRTKWWKSPEILTSAGLLLYFAGSVPLISMSNYLIDYSVELYSILFYTINYGLANLRYFLLALSFFFILKTAGENQLILRKARKKTL